MFTESITWSTFSKWAHIRLEAYPDGLAVVVHQTELVRFLNLSLCTATIFHQYLVDLLKTWTMSVPVNHTTRRSGYSSVPKTAYQMGQIHYRTGDISKRSVATSVPAFCMEENSSSYSSTNRCTAFLRTHSAFERRQSYTFSVPSLQFFIFTRALHRVRRVRDNASEIFGALF